ncbi:DUF5722 domain-containing protein [Planctomycetaceae bacterium SH139]
MFGTKMNSPVVVQNVQSWPGDLKLGSSMHVVARLIVPLWLVTCLFSIVSLADELPLPLQPRYLNQIEFNALENGEYHVRTMGSDPYIEFDLPRVLGAAEMPVLSFEYFSSDGIQSLEVRLRRSRGAWVGPIDAGSLTRAEGWIEGTLPLLEEGRTLWQTGTAEILRIDFGMEAGKTLKLRSVRVRSYTEQELRDIEVAEERRQVKLQMAEQWRQYLAPEAFVATIDAVTVTAEQIQIRGSIHDDIFADYAGQLHLTEVLPHEVSVAAENRPSVAELVLDGDADAVSQANEVLKNHVFEVEVERYVDGYDRLLSRWQVVVQDDGQDSQAGPGKSLSAATYATHLDLPRDAELPPPAELRNAKGLGGVSPVFGLAELSELGVRHITLNVVVTNLIEPVELPGAESFEFGGKRWWVRPGRLAHVDQAAKYASEHGITAAAIILLPQRANDILVHPESRSSGIYAMPNLTNAEATEKYAAVMHMLARRYAGNAHGRIDHWIMHNEVDFGWVWTNMGEQPLAMFMDHYVRSMRIADLQARQFNPFAKVFISLTHHWNAPEDPRWRTYPPRKLLDHLSRLGAVEGDFDWGVAYHPYPQNLFEPRTWLDSRVSNDFETPLITMKNLGVLKRYLQQERFLDGAGKMRSVLLSEQGYHTPDYEQPAQRLQGAALLYTWDRLRETDFVLAYDYHRWVDAAEEGGLLLGLRTVSSAGKIAGEKKLGWEVYRDINTTAESRWREELEALYRDE